jgi:large subunit ribosomal protein L15
MQLHSLKPKLKSKSAKRVGRGGKRGTFSGHGSKGQKARAGHRIRPGFRGGDNPIWKLFPKQRGASKKVDIKHQTFQVTNSKPAVVNFTTINDRYLEGETVSKRTLLKKGIINTGKHGIKVLADGNLKKKLVFSGLEFSKSAREKAEKAGATFK